MRLGDHPPPKKKSNPNLACNARCLCTADDEGRSYAETADWFSTFNAVFDIIFFTRSRVDQYFKNSQVVDLGVLGSQMIH